ncbi:DUF3800 domain-containing protein [Bacillus thermotolerans]|uniref:DUF3800 domain-containing protein n=1 Tax=Bacillus thermotolerans TaxID=1221996 RepID=UPI00057E4EE5|nr:DUF3800 domain-containing protein [Bacillus thermotolerans]KKB33783.1 hypothetical protein QY97_02994 [Bacillus thermotolerans]
MKYYIFLDDSGQLHCNYKQNDYFVYGGLLVKESDFHGINASYKKMIRQVKKEKGIKGEFKTAQMDIKTRRRLLSKLRTYTCEQIFVSVKVSTLVRLDFSKKRDIVRYKNYLIKRLIEQLIQHGKLPKACTFAEIHIDNQNVAHSAKDSLQDYLFNIFNEDNYYLIHQQYQTTSFNCDFRVLFKDSSSNYLIQAADLLANTKCHILCGNTSDKLLKSGYTCVKLPDGVIY